MKVRALERLNLEAGLKCCYEDVQPFLLAELESLREQLVLLPEDAPEADRLACIKACVESLNKLDTGESGHGIDTEERDALCHYLDQMSGIVGLHADCVDEWREW